VLLQLARDTLQPLTASEESFVTHAAEDKPFDGHGCELRAGVIVWLCAIKDATSHVGWRGLRLKNCRIEGRLELRSLQIEWPLEFRVCIFRDAIDVANCELVLLRFAECELRGIRAVMLSASAGVEVTRSHVAGPFELSGARIALLNLNNSHFANPGATALSLGACRIDYHMNCWSATFNGNVEGRSLRVGTWVRFSGARVDGFVDLRAASIGGPIEARGLRCRRRFDLRTAQVGGEIDMIAARLVGTGEPSIDLKAATVGGSVFLRDARLRSISLVDAKLGGHITLAGSRCVQRRGWAIDAIGLSVQGDVNLTDLHAIGGVRFNNTRISGALLANRSSIRTQSAVALTLAYSTIGRAVDLEGATIVGSITGQAVHVEGGVSFARSFICSISGPAIHLDTATIDGHLGFRDAVLIGPVRLGWASFGSDILFQNTTICGADDEPVVLFNGATIVRNVAILASRFRGKSHLMQVEIGGRFMIRESSLGDGRAFALAAPDCTVGGIAIYRGRFYGAVSFDRSTVRGALAIAESRYLQRQGTPFALRNISVGGDVAISNVRSYEGLALTASTLGANLSIRDSLLATRAVNALELDGTTIRGGLTVVGNRLHGRASMAGARVDSFAIFGACEFREFGGLVADGASVRKGLSWTGIRRRGETAVRLSLIDADVGVWIDDDESRPAQDELFLTGFRYSAIEDLPSGDDGRLEWLALQKQPSAQSYEQLARTYHAAGHEASARKVAIGKNVVAAKSSKWYTWARFSSIVSRWVIGYGYKPQWAIAWSVAVILAGTLTFAYTHDLGLFAPAKEMTTAALYPHFNSAAYSLDAFLPLLDLQQEQYWRPVADSRCRVVNRWSVPCGAWLQMYQWTQTVLGWLLTSLSVAGLTGLIRRS